MTSPIPQNSKNKFQKTKKNNCKKICTSVDLQQNLFISVTNTLFMTITVSHSSDNGYNTPNILVID